MKYPIFKVWISVGKIIVERRENGSFDSSRKALSYQAIKKFSIFVSDYLKINPRIITCRILHESSVARFPADKFARAHVDYWCISVECTWPFRIDCTKIPQTQKCSNKFCRWGFQWCRNRTWVQIFEDSYAMMNRSQISAQFSSSLKAGRISKSDR